MWSYVPESSLRSGRRAEAQRSIKAQWPYTPQVGAPHPVRPEKTDGTTTACAGHWYTTPHVKTEKPQNCNQKK
ncbi:hypothetical protein ECZU34_64210 [Escherichia coli]|nr:hypothetical protein ECZU34_64210 [Escherichia coli]